MGNDQTTYKISKNSEDYRAPKLIDPNAKCSTNKEDILSKSSFNINNPHQPPNNQYETTYKSGFEDKSSMRNKTLYNFGNRPTIKVINNGLGSYTSESKQNYKMKINDISLQEIKDKKGVVERIKKHHWDNGSNKGYFNTTYTDSLQYDKNRAKFAPVYLSEDQKNDLKYSHYVLGQGKSPYITTQLNSFLPNNNFKPTYSDGKLKNSSINFNPKFGNIKGSTIYMKDYTAKENIE